jgi:hypothetical protein
VGSNSEVRRQPAHSNAVREAFPTIDSLTSAAEDVRSLLSHPGWTHLCRLLDAEVADLDVRLDGGRLLESRAEYAHLHGQRRGLGAASGLAHAIVREADKRLEREHERIYRGADALREGIV